MSVVAETARADAFTYIAKVRAEDGAGVRAMLDDQVVKLARSSLRTGNALMKLRYKTMIDVFVEEMEKMDLAPKELGQLKPIPRKRTTEVQREAAAKKRSAPVEAQEDGAKTKARGRSKARPAVVVGGSMSATRKQPKFRCIDHGIDLIYVAEVGHWVCTEAGCTTTRKAEISDASGVTKITGSPKVVVKYDSDGDPSYYLHYEAHNLMIDLPYGVVVGHKVFNQTVTSTLVVNLHVEEFAFLNEKGDPIPTAEINDR